MKRDDLRLLAGIPFGRAALGPREFTVKEDGEGHFDFALQDEENVKKVAIALVKASLPCDITFAMDYFYFNFKDANSLNQAKKLASSLVKPQDMNPAATPAETPAQAPTE